MTNIKFWVSELNEKAQQEVVNKVYNNLKAEGYDMESEEMKNFMEDVKNEKLGSLDYHLTYEEMVKLSEMK